MKYTKKQRNVFGKEKRKSENEKSRERKRYTSKKEKHVKQFSIEAEKQYKGRFSKMARGFAVTTRKIKKQL